MLQVWLIATETDKIRLPVLPEEITLECENAVERVTLHDLGEAVLPGKPKLKTIDIESYFPARRDSNANYADLPDPARAAALLRAWCDGGVLLRLVVLGGALPLNLPVVLTGCGLTVGKLAGDVEYHLSLVEHKDLRAMRETESAISALRTTVLPPPPPVYVPPPPAPPVVKRYPRKNKEKKHPVSVGVVAGKGVTHLLN